MLRKQYSMGISRVTQFETEKSAKQFINIAISMQHSYRKVIRQVKDSERPVCLYIHVPSNILRYSVNLKYSGNNISQGFENNRQSSNLHKLNYK